MKLNKKAIGFGLILVFIFLALIAAVFLQSARLREGGEFPVKTLGNIQVEALKTYQKAERSLLYIDLAALHSSQDTFLTLASKGGFDEAKCGDQQKYNLWSTAAKKLDECFPDYPSNAVKLLRKNFDKFISQAPPEVRGLKLDKYITSSLYDFTLTGNNVIATTSKMKHLLASVEKTSLDYAFNPSFSIKTNYDIEEYEQLKKQAAKINQDCSGQTCIKEKITEFNKNKLKWSLQEECDFTNFISCFQANSTKQLPYKGQITYRFAVYFDFPAIKPTAVYDHKQVTNAVVIEFEPSQKTDITQYTVYFSQNPDLDEQSPSHIIKMEDIKKLEVRRAPNFEICNLAGGQACTYGTGIEFEDNTAFRHENKIYYVLSNTTLQADTDYYFTIQAINNEGRKTDLSEPIKGKPITKENE